MRAAVLSLLSATALLLAQSCARVEEGSSLEPPASVKNFRDFLRWRSDIEELWISAGVDRGAFVVLLAETSLTASGPPAYAFDDQGRFLRWTDDSGEGFVEKHLGRGPVRAVEAELALTWTTEP